MMSLWVSWLMRRIRRFGYRRRNYARFVAWFEGQQLVFKRETAQLAGKMVSMAPAIRTARIQSRHAAQALVGLEDWDEAISSPEKVIEEARLFLELLHTRNGRTRWKQGRVLTVRAIGDASDLACVELIRWFSNASAAQSVRCVR